MNPVKRRSQKIAARVFRLFRLQLPQRLRMEEGSDQVVQPRVQRCDDEVSSSFAGTTVNRLVAGRRDDNRRVKMKWKLLKKGGHPA